MDAVGICDFLTPQKPIVKQVIILLNGEYEIHVFNDKELPIFFHRDIIKAGENYVIPHWHGSVEFLYFLEGRARVTLSDKTFEAEKDNVVVVNSGIIHSLHPLTDKVIYHCLIVDQEFCSTIGVRLQELYLKELITDEHVNRFFRKIVREYDSKDTYYKPSVRALITSLLIYLCRNRALLQKEAPKSIEQPKIKITKDAIEYIRRNYTSECSTSEIGQAIGVSLFHLCRCFKEVTGVTIISYLNLLRCDSAKTLLATGNYSVSEAAMMSGFQNMSYFTKTYKQYKGCIPSKEK